MLSLPARSASDGRSARRWRSGLVSWWRKQATLPSLLPNAKRPKTYSPSCKELSGFRELTVRECP